MSVMIRRLILMNLVLTAGIVGISLLPRPAAAAVLFDCCKSSTAGQRFCCDNCCWFTHNCSVDGQCGFEEET